MMVFYKSILKLDNLAMVFNLGVLKVVVIAAFLKEVKSNPNTTLLFCDLPHSHS